MAQHLVVLRICFGDPGNRMLRDDQYMNQRLRPHIAEGQNQVIFVDDLSLDLASDNSLKKRLTTPQRTTKAGFVSRASWCQQERRKSTIGSLSSWQRALQRSAPANCFTHP